MNETGMIRIELICTDQTQIYPLHRVIRVP